ncbi:hypothetical protein HA402_005138 [Bradysia odoriphaga]|nr:hypothetical protein HA402_005138 [Bradysia odoriphaga]
MSFSCSVYVSAFVVAILSTDAATRGDVRPTCREPTIFQNINLTRILGHWYEYSRYDHDFEQGCDCYTTDVKSIDAISFHVSNCCQMTRVSNETQICNIGINNARIVNADKNEALFLYTRNGVESEFWIIDTDYENYMIVNGCERVSVNEENELFWIMTRDKGIFENVERKIADVLQTNRFEKNKIIQQRHGADVCKSKRPPMERGNKGRGHGN